MNVSAQNLDSTKGKNESYKLTAQLLQPWSTPVLKTELAPEVLKKMIDLTDLLVDDDDAKSFGKNLVGQIEKEFVVTIKALDEAGVLGFFENIVREFVALCKTQKNPFDNSPVSASEWRVALTSCWVVSQRPNEYNPLHYHRDHISAVTYLKVPRRHMSRKAENDRDGCIEFINTATADKRLSSPQLAAVPSVGDLYIFSASQMHTVYPYRCPDDVIDTERRSMSFNALFERA